MKTNTPVYNTIRKQTAVKALPRLIAEFNHNRYGKPTADNSPLDSINNRDGDLFPINSIVGPLRPRRGSLKASVEDANVLPPYNPLPPTTRFHIAEQEDYYKYWSSPTWSNTAAPYDFPTDPDSLYATNTNPQVTYQSTVLTNKIIIGLENSLASPDDYDIYAKATVGGAWIKIADETNTVINSDGRIILYYNGSGWTQTVSRNNHIAIAGIQLRVQSMSKGNQYLNVIEIAACLEKDLTPYLQTDSDTFDLGDVTVLTPIGRISSNIATITLFNALVDEDDIDKGLLFNDDNVDSIYYGLLKENVKFTMSYEYDATQQGGSATESVQQFVMYAEENWGADLEETVDISVRDVSKYLQEINAPETFFEAKGQMSVGEIVWMLLDAVGFVDYNIDIADTTNPLSMDFFWCDSTTKIWDVLGSLAEGTQTAMYVDSYGILQIKTKETAFDPTATPVWHLRSVDSGEEKADIVSISGERKDIANSVKLSYSVVDYKRTSNNNYLNETMWEPEGTVMLQSSDLQANLVPGATYVKILALEATEWPYKGMMQVEGELISYEGKEYTYIDDTTGGTTKTVLIKSADDYTKYLYKTNTEKQYMNRFTGNLKITGRGLWNTVEATHNTQGYVYKTYRMLNGNTKRTTNGFTYYGSEFSDISGTTKYESQKAYARLLSTTKYGSNDWIHASYNGGTGGQAPRYYGMKFRLRSGGQRNHVGGLMISGNQTTGAGYFIEFRPGTNATSKARAVRVYSKDSAGNVTQKSGKGFVSSAIVMNKWNTLDVQFSNSGSTHSIWLWLNGRYLGKVNITSDKQSDSDCFGMFIRASSCYEFDYLYAFNRFDLPENTQRWGDDVSFYDRVKNGYIVNQSLDEFTTGTTSGTRRIKGKNKKVTDLRTHKFFDEFGPVCHEVREFDIKYEDKLPGNYIKFLPTNNTTAKYLDFRATAFGAHFYAVNVSHDAVEVNGENQSMGIYARNIAKSEEKTKTFEDTESIRVNGRKETTFQSDWIQSDSQAENLGTWIQSHWDNETDEITVEIFGNPLIELTDIVQITDPQSDRVAEKYFVIGTNTDFSAGVGTTLRLRKVKV